MLLMDVTLKAKCSYPSPVTAKEDLGNATLAIYIAVNGVLPAIHLQIRWSALVVKVSV